MRRTLLILTVVLAVRFASAAELSSEERVAGKKLYAAKCAGCHKLYDPSAYDETKWSGMDGQDAP